MVNGPASVPLEDVPASGGSSSIEMETTKFDDWPFELGPHLTSAEARKVRAFICSYRRCFIFSLQDLEGYKEKPIHVQ